MVRARGGENASPILLNDQPASYSARTRACSPSLDSAARTSHSEVGSGARRADVRVRSITESLYHSGRAVYTGEHRRGDEELYKEGDEE